MASVRRRGVWLGRGALNGGLYIFPASDTFTSTWAHDRRAERSHATLLNNGLVLIAGGKAGMAYLGQAETWINRQRGFVASH